jgi:hydroxymethylglutaryl-CoA synthase
MKLGIDCISFYTPHYYLDLATLAAARGVDVDKYKVGLGQDKMAVTPPDEDIVTFAANAAYPLLKQVDVEQIDTVFLATESGIDQSKAAGIFVHHLLNLPKNCRVVEVKQACYSATAALQMALSYVARNPKRKVLIIASDIARYGLNTTGESSQGGGAVAMVISTEPRLLAIEPESGIYTEDAMDFWRPNYREEALVDGRFSCELYLKALKETWQHYQQTSERDFIDHEHFCFHIPFPRLAQKAYQKLSMVNGLKKPVNGELRKQLEHSLYYSEQIGNCYTASLYLGLLSLLENDPKDLSGQRIGLYSYGSGCVAEFFSGVVQEGYQSVLCKMEHHELLDNRTALSQAEYEAFYQFRYPTDGSKFIVPKHQVGRYRLAKLDQHKRVYELTCD